MPTVLRSKTPALVEQELWGLFLAHCAVRQLMACAACQQGLDPDRLSFVHTLRVIEREILQVAAIPPPPSPGQAVADAPLALIGPGTGLGVSGLLRAHVDGYVAIAGEGGHVTRPAADDAEAAVVAWLRERFGHASAERAQSGPGLVNLYQAAAHLSGQPVQAFEPAQVIVGARAGTCAACRSAVGLFCSFLGSVAGNLALTLGARGGVYIGGGIVPRLLPELEGSRFRDRFEGKGRFQDYLVAIPTFVIDAAESPAFMGASRALDIG